MASDGPMSIDAHIDETLTAAPPNADDAWRERELAILSELAEAGLEIAQALKGRIVEAAASAEPDNATACADLTRAFDRASRAVRMAIALRRRLLKDAAAGAPDPRSAAREARTERVGRVRRIVKRITKENFGAGRLYDALDTPICERLTDPDIMGELTDRPIGAVVAEICEVFGLKPSWLERAQEAWAQAEIAGRPPGSPYAAWPDLPPEEPYIPLKDPEDDDEGDEDCDPDDENFEDDDPDDPEGEDGRGDPGGSDPRSPT
jgi:hypothetical protein